MYFGISVIEKMKDHNMDDNLSIYTNPHDAGASHFRCRPWEYGYLPICFCFNIRRWCRSTQLECIFTKQNHIV